MPDNDSPMGEGLFLGEWTRSLDDRFRFSLPPEWSEELGGETATCVLAKERPGCISVWNAKRWDEAMADGVSLVAGKIRSGLLANRIDQVQRFGRLLSTRHRTVPIAGRGRLVVPDSFRDFLEVEAGGDMLVVGAAVCVELWHPRRWSEHIGDQMPQFRELFDQLAD